MVVSNSIDLFFHVVLLACAIYGVAALFTEGMLFEHIGKRLDEAQPATRWWFKPFILCPTCMSSVWGTAYALHLGLGFADWVIMVLATAGLNFIIANK